MSDSTAFGLSETFERAVELAAAITVRVDGRGQRPASGICWSEGVILATDHTLERDEDIGVTLPDGSTVTATIVGRDPSSDLAVLRVPEGSCDTPLMRAETPKVGSIVLAIARPREIGASAGIVSSVGGLGRGRGRRGIPGLIRPELTMYPGFSGGPLVNLRGEVIGINTSGMRGGALTVPLEVADDIVAQLLSHGRLRRGYLGLTSQPVQLPTTVVDTAGQATGLLVVGIEPGSPADAGGVFVGDILLALAGEALRDTDDLREALSADYDGQAAELRVLRGGQPQTLAVTLGER